MSFFEYVAVLVSIIVALGIAQILFGFARTIEKPEGQKVYWVHLLWAIWLFLFQIFFWWFEFGLNSISDWTFSGYLVVVLYATILFLAAAVLFPTREHGGIDFEERFFSRRKWFFGLLLAQTAVDFPDTFMKGAGHLGDLGTSYWLIQGVSGGLYLGGIISANRRFHAVIVLIRLVHQLYFIYQQFFQMA